VRLVSPRLVNWATAGWPDHQGELVERDRHAPSHRRFDRQLVVPSTNVLDQGVAGDHHPGAAVLPEAMYRPEARL
jgi:hypothetical protein